MTGFFYNGPTPTIWDINAMLYVSYEKVSWISLYYDCHVTYGYYSFCYRYKGAIHYI